jgi:hypothetical protein
MEALFELFLKFLSEKDLAREKILKKRVRTAGLHVIEFLNVLLLKIYKIIVVILLHQN